MNQNNDLSLIELNEENLESMIYEIRGQRVMLDFDLARIYGYETKYFNRQVKNNLGKFPEDFMFQLNAIESEKISRCKNFTMNRSDDLRGFNVKYCPYAFTEKGIYMLMTVLRGELAIKQSIALIRLFEKMKNYIVSSNNISSVDELLKLTNQVAENTKSIQKLECDSAEIKNQLTVVMDNFIDPSKYEEFLILNGQKVEADLAYQQIYSFAKHSIIIIDDYIGIKTLHLLLSADKNVQVTIVSDNVSRNPLQEEFIEDFIKESGISLQLIPSNNQCHDRFIVIDYQTDKERIYLCGSSSKDAGERATTINEANTNYIYHPLFDLLIKQ